MPSKLVNPKTGRYYAHYRLPGDVRGSMPLEIRKKIADARTGRKHSLETKRKIRAAMSGRTHTSESKSLISEAMKRAWHRRKKQTILK